MIVVIEISKTKFYKVGRLSQPVPDFTYRWMWNDEIVLNVGLSLDLWNLNNSRVLSW